MCVVVCTCKSAFLLRSQEGQQAPEALRPGGKQMEQLAPQGGMEKSLRGNREAGVVWNSGPRTWHHRGEVYWFHSQEIELDGKEQDVQESQSVVSWRAALPKTRSLGRTMVTGGRRQDTDFSRSSHW